MAVTEALTRPIGPLPAWQWGLVIGGGYVAYRVISHRGGSSSSNSGGTAVGSGSNIVQGPQGETGATGNTGAAGAVGAVGAPGKNGITKVITVVKPPAKTTNKPVNNTGHPVAIIHPPSTTRNNQPIQHTNTKVVKHPTTHTIGSGVEVKTHILSIAGTHNKPKPKPKRPIRRTTAKVVAAPTIGVKMGSGVFYKKAL